MAQAVASRPPSAEVPIEVLHQQLETIRRRVAGSHESTLFDKGRKLGHSVVDLGYCAVYAPGSSYQGILGDFLVSPPRDKIDWRTPMDDQNDVVHFTGGVIANSDLKLPFKVSQRQAEIAFISFGVMHAMTEVVTEELVV